MKGCVYCYLTINNDYKKEKSLQIVTLLAILKIQIRLLSSWAIGIHQLNILSTFKEALIGIYQFLAV